MKWFIIVFMFGLHSDGTKDSFVYLEPEFETVEMCSQYVREQSNAIGQHMQMEFGQGRRVEQVFCMQKHMLEKFLEEIKNVNNGVKISF